MTQQTRKGHIVRALMESVGFQLHEIIDAMLLDMKLDKLELLRVDGGMAKNGAFLQVRRYLLHLVQLSDSFHEFIHDSLHPTYVVALSRGQRTQK